MIDLNILERVIVQRQEVIDSIPVKEQEVDKLKLQENDIQLQIDALEAQKEEVSKKADTLEKEIANIDVEQLNKDISEAQAIIDYFNKPAEMVEETTSNSII